MAESWWANRVGDIAIATTTSTFPQPEYGAAYDIGTMPWSNDPGTYDVMRNAVQTKAADKEEAEQERTFWDNLSGLAGNVGDVVGGFLNRNVGTPLSEEWEIRTKQMPWLQDAADAGGEALGWISRNIIEPAERGIKTPVIAANISEARAADENPFGPGGVLSPGWKHFFQGDVWEDAWDRSAEQSFGQSTVDAAVIGFGDKPTLIDPHGRPSEQLQDWREHNTAYNLTSGGVDALFMWYASPEVLTAKGVGAAGRLARGNIKGLSVATRQNVSHIITTTDDEFANLSLHGPVEQVAGRIWRPRVQKLREGLAKGEITIEDLAQTRAFRDSPNGASMAYLYQQAAKDDDLWRDVVRMGMGDVAAVQRLETKSKELSDVINDLLNQKLDLDDQIAKTEAIIGRSQQVLAKTPDKANKWLELQTSWRVIDREALDAKRGSVLEQLAEYDDFDRFLAHTDNKFSSMSEFVPLGPGLTDIGAKTRSFASWRPKSSSRVGVKAYAAARSWFIRRPGTIDLSRAEGSWDNVKAHLDQIQTYGRPATRADDAGAEVWDAFRQHYLDRMAAAVTDTDRLAVAEALEVETFRTLGAKHGLNKREIEGLVDEWRLQRNSQYDHMIRNTSKRRLSNGRDAWEYRYLDDDGAEVVDRLAIDPTELPNYYVLPDVKRLDQMLDRHSDMLKPWLQAKASRAGHVARDSAIGGMEFFNHIWKPLVLLRPAWPVRVFLDEHLRASSALGSLSYMITAPLGGIARGTANIAGGAWNRALGSYQWHNSRIAARNFDEALEERRSVTAPADVFDLDNVDAVKHRRIGHARNARQMWRDSQRSYGTNKSITSPPKEYNRLAATVRALTTEDKTLEGIAINPATGTRIKAGHSVLPFPHTNRRIPASVSEDALLRHVDDFVDDNRALLAHRDRFLVMRREGDEYVLDVGHRRKSLDDALEFAARSNADYVIDNTGGWQELIRDVDDPLTPLEAAARTKKPIGQENVHQIRQRDNETTDIAQNLVSEAGASKVASDVAAGFDIDLTYKHKTAGKALTFRRKDGSTVTIPAPFDGPGGAVHLSINSADGGFSRLYRGHAMTLDKLRASQRRKVVGPGEAGYADEYARILNDHFRNSPLLTRLMDGWSDEKLVSWLKTSKDGREIVRRMPTRGQNPERWVDDLRMMLDDYAPAGSQLRSVLRERAVRPDEVERLTGTRNLPMVDGVALENTLGVAGSAAIHFDAIVQRLYRVMGTLPTDALIRNPFFAANYRHKINELMEAWGDEAISEARIQQFASIGREHALKQTRKYLFSLAEESNAIHALRFMAPFANAQFESITRWARIITDHPEAFVRLYAEGWADLGDLYGFQEVDQDGNPVASTLSPHSNHKIVVQFDKGFGKILAKMLPDDVVAMSEGFTFNKDSLQIVLQSDPWYVPGAGPILQLPAIPFSQKHPEWYDAGGFKQAIYRYLNPIGVPDSALDAVIPGYIRQTIRYFNENEDPRFNNLEVQVLKQMEMDWKRGGRQGPEPSPKRAHEIAKQIQFVAAASAWASPAGTGGIRLKSQFFVDQWRKYQKTYGAEAGLRYYNDFGEDLYMFTQSTSKSMNGVSPTTIGFKQYKKFQDFVDANPELGGIIVGPAGWTKGADFNPEVYEFQRRETLGPGQQGTQRQSQSPVDARKAWEAATGWQEYTKLNQAVQAELEARGLTSINQRGAEDLADIKRFAVQDISSRYKGWAEDFGQIDLTRSYRVIGQLKTFAFDKQFDGIPHMEGLREYLDVWDAVTQELESRRAAGGSADITANSNEDLLNIFNFAAGDIAQRNIEFGDVYYRYLERYQPTRGIG